LKVVFTSVYVG